MSHTRLTARGPISVDRTPIGHLTEVLVACWLARGERVGRSEATRRALMTEIGRLGGTLPVDPPPAPPAEGEGGGTVAPAAAAAGPAEISPPPHTSGPERTPNEVSPSGETSET